MWIDRFISEEILGLSSQYPVVMITGPRQSGKTSLCRKLFPNKPYYNLENPDTRLIIETDPRRFFKSNPHGAVIDEFQRYPELLSYMQGVVDEKPENGQYVLTGSSNIVMLKGVTQSLAGRVGIVKLLPLSLKEITNKTLSGTTTNDYILRGFYPRVIAENLQPVKAYRNYYETYIERDVRQLMNIKDLHSFQKFIRLCAGRTGHLLNASNLSNEVGVTIPTINAWLNLLQATYIVFLLQPYSVNINRRIVKTPKLYFYDVGIASYLLGIENEKHLENHPLRGNLFENMIVSEMLKRRYNIGLDNNLYFYRDNHGNEVDIIQTKGHLFNAFEIKSAQTFSSHFLKNLDYIKKIAPDFVADTGLLYDGDENIEISGHKICNFRVL